MGVGVETRAQSEGPVENSSLQVLTSLTESRAKYSRVLRRPSYGHGVSALQTELMNAAPVPALTSTAGPGPPATALYA